MQLGTAQPQSIDLLLASTDSGKFIAALEFAMAQMALGKKARLFLQGEAAVLLQLPLSAPQDTARTAAGFPDLAGLLAEAADMGLSLIVCQSGLLIAGLTPDAIWPQAEISGLISFLASGSKAQAPLIF